MRNFGFLRTPTAKANVGSVPPLCNGDERLCVCGRQSHVAVYEVRPRNSVTWPGGA